VTCWLRVMPLGTETIPFVVSSFIIKVSSFKTFSSRNFGWLFHMFSIVYNSIICLHCCTLFDSGILMCLHFNYLLYIIVPYMVYRTWNWNNLQFGQLCLPWISFSSIYIFYLSAYSSFQIHLLFLVPQLTCNLHSQVSGSYACLTFWIYIVPAVCYTFYTLLLRSMLLMQRLLCLFWGVLWGCL
jgi:hypothetical protein